LQQNLAQGTRQDDFGHSSGSPMRRAPPHLPDAHEWHREFGAIQEKTTRGASGYDGRSAYREGVMAHQESPADYKGHSIIVSGASFIASGPHQANFSIYRKRDGKTEKMVHEGISKECNNWQDAFDAAYSNARKWIDEHPISAG
jgi:hypothetical protein